MFRRRRRDPYLEIGAHTIKSVCSSLHAHDLLGPHTAGNISIRYPEDRIIVSRAGADLSRLHSPDLLLLGYDATSKDSLLTGVPARNATSEFKTIHDVVYKKFPQTNCVLHTHAFNTVAAGLISKEGALPFLHYYQAHLGQDLTPVVEWALPGTYELRVKIVESVLSYPRGKTILLRNHGCVVWGSTIYDAVKNLVLLDNACKLFVQVHSALPKGVPSNLEIPFRDMPLLADILNVLP